MDFHFVDEHSFDIYGTCHLLPPNEGGIREHHTVGRLLGSRRLGPIIPIIIYFT